jgi:phage baseplate assembly protein gpV
MSDCIAYTGFGSFEGTVPSDEDVWIFNNRGSDSYNHIRCKSDGSITMVTTDASVELTQDGELNITTASTVNVNSTGSVNVDTPSTVNVTSISGINMIAPLTTITGNVLVNGNITATLEVAALSGQVGLSTHTTTGVTGGPSTSGPPKIPS